MPAWTQRISNIKLPTKEHLQRYLPRIRLPKWKSTGNSQRNPPDLNEKTQRTKRRHSFDSYHSYPSCSRHAYHIPHGFDPHDEEKPMKRRDSQLQPQYKTYPQAWLALVLLVLLRISVTVFQFTFSVVPETTSDFFHVSLTAVNWLATVQGVMYVLVSFFSGWIVEHLGVKHTLCVAGLINAIGASIRLVASKLQPPSFPALMVGQVIGSVAAPLSLNIMTKFASTWFTEDQRATAGMFVASNYGAIISMFMIPAITKAPEQIPTTASLLVITFIAIGGFLPIVFMPAKPPTPPSAAEDVKRPPFIKGLRILMHNFWFWVLFLIHGINVGLSIAYATIFTQVISPYGYTNTEAGQINAVAFFAGIIGCTTAGPVLDKTKQHKLFLKMIAPLVLLTDIGFIFLIKPDSFAAILFVMALNQCFLSFLVPVVTDLGTETGYPVADATTSSLLWQGSQAFGFVLVIVMDTFRDPNGDPPNNLTGALILQAGLSGGVTVFSLLFKGRLRRLEHAERKLQETGAYIRRRSIQSLGSQTSQVHSP